MPAFLLLCFVCLQPAQAESEFDKPVQQAYAEILKLRIENGRSLIRAERQRDPSNICAILVENYADFLTLMVTQDQKLYPALLEKQEERLEQIRKLKERTPWKNYAVAEVRLHMALCKLFFGNEIKAAWDVRQAYLTYEQNARQYPSFLPNKKSFGLLQVMLGSVPDNYRWFLGLIGMEANARKGIADLKQAATGRHPFQTEAHILHSLVQEIVYKEENHSQELFEKLSAAEPDNLLFCFLKISAHKKAKNCEAALQAFQRRPLGKDYLPFLYLHHMAGDIYLYRGDYDRSVRENQFFLANHRGKHYVKNTHFKLYLAYLLDGEKQLANEQYQLIGTEGAKVVEEDIYAQKFFDSREQPDRHLLRARLYTDGGYYQQALTALAGFKVDEAGGVRERAEFYYRKARVYHGMEDIEQAKHFYRKTIQVSGNHPYYFAPNAALQMGYLSLDGNDKVTARAYFKKAMSYPQHEYKNSIDSKAKLALSAL